MNTPIPPHSASCCRSNAIAELVASAISSSDPDSDFCHLDTEQTADILDRMFDEPGFLTRQRVGAAAQVVVGKIAIPDDGHLDVALVVDTISGKSLLLGGWRDGED